MSHPLVSLGPGAGYRTHIVTEGTIVDGPDSPVGLRVVSEVAVRQFTETNRNREGAESNHRHGESSSEGDDRHDQSEGNRDGDSTRRLGRSRRKIQGKTAHASRSIDANNPEVMQRWRLRGRLARWLGFLDHEDAVATPPGTSTSNTLARYRVALLQLRCRADRIRGITRAMQTSDPRNVRGLHKQSDSTHPSLFSENLPHAGQTSTRTTQPHAASARSASGLSNASDEPCLFPDDARAGRRPGRQQSHRARAREAARVEGSSDAGAEPHPFLSSC